MTEDEARSLTDEIKKGVEVLWSMLFIAHERQAWRSLGYADWKEYVKVEFDMSKQYSYRILDQARVINTIRDAIESPMGDSSEMSPVGDISISERQARDIKPILPQVVGRIRERIEEEAAEPSAAPVLQKIVEEVVEEERQKIVARRKEDAELREMERELGIDKVTPERLENDRRIEIVSPVIDALRKLAGQPSPEEFAPLVPCLLYTSPSPRD